MAFRYKGIKTVVDTTDTAQFDIDSYQITEASQKAVEQNFSTVPFSKNDVSNGAVHARTIDGYDYFFIVGQQEDKLVVTIGGVQTHESEDALRKCMKLAEKVGLFRGVSGV